MTNDVVLVATANYLRMVIFSLSYQIKPDKTQLLAKFEKNCTLGLEPP